MAFEKQLYFCQFNYNLRGKKMKLIGKNLASLLLIIGCVLNLFSCVTVCKTNKYFEMKEAGYYPDTSDFPDTTWVCREVNMYFYMFDYGESTMLGEYTVDDKTYRVDIKIHYADMSFDFYSHTNISRPNSKNDSYSGFINCKREEAGFLATEYIYENDIITCKIKNTDQNIWNYEGDTITFEKAGAIAINPISKWYCKALNMYLIKYDDIYYKGEIVVDNITNYVHAIEIGNSKYYQLSIENGKINNLKEGTVSPFVNMFFEQRENKIIATVTNECNINDFSYSYWKTNETTFEFVEQLLSKSEYQKRPY